MIGNAQDVKSVVASLIVHVVENVVASLIAQTVNNVVASLTAQIFEICVASGTARVVDNVVVSLKHRVSNMFSSLTAQAVRDVAASLTAQGVKNVEILGQELNYTIQHRISRTTSGTTGGQHRNWMSQLSTAADERNITSKYHDDRVAQYSDKHCTESE